MRRSCHPDPVDSPGRRPTAPSWTGTAWFGPWWLVYRGPVAPTGVHAHYALQATPDPSVSIFVGGSVRCGPVVITPNERHAIVTGADEATLIYIDGDAARGRSICDRSTWTDLQAPNDWRSAQAIAHAVAPIGPRAPEPEAVRRARLALSECDDNRPLRDIAGDVGLSVSRLSHLFTDVVGVPMRSYRRWQRLLIAAELVANGAGLTAAAHGSGFADGPHLARTFHRHFGLSVSEMTGGVRFITS